jgi:hypothetical protein
MILKIGTLRCLDPNGRFFALIPHLPSKNVTPPSTSFKTSDRLNHLESGLGTIDM